MSEVHKAARLNMTRKGTAFDTAFHEAQQVSMARPEHVCGGTAGKQEGERCGVKTFFVDTVPPMYATVLVGAASDRTDGFGFDRRRLGPRRFRLYLLSIFSRMPGLACASYRPKGEA